MRETKGAYNLCGLEANATIAVKNHNDQNNTS